MSEIPQNNLHESPIIGVDAMAATTPYNPHGFRDNYLPYLKENDYVIKDWITFKGRRRYMLYTWPSLLKIGLIRAAKARRAQRERYKRLKQAREIDPLAA